MPEEKITIADIVKGLVFIAFLYVFCILFMQILTATIGYFSQSFRIENKILSIISVIITLIIVSFIGSLGKSSGELLGLGSTIKVLSEVKSRFTKKH